MNRTSSYIEPGGLRETSRRRPARIQARAYDGQRGLVTM
jgi:hypothetical protein